LCRSEDNRCPLALPLRVLRGYGRFLEAEETVPTCIVNHLGAQESSPVLFVGGIRRPSTESDYAERIRRYLGYVHFHRDLQRELADWAASCTLEGLSIEELTQQAERRLRLGCVALRDIYTIYQNLAGSRLLQGARHKSEDCFVLRILVLFLKYMIL
jgi:hypothetical protein